MKDRYQEVKKVLGIVLWLNLLVAAAKFFYGVFSNSASMIADGYHSLSDGLSNVIGLIGIRFCLPNKDDGHPYGHKKYETLFALGIAAMLFMVAINLCKQGIYRIIHPVTPDVDFISFTVMLGTMLINIIVMKYEHKKGKELNSDILVVDSMHTRADIFTSFSVIIALIGIKIGFPIIDPIVTFMIAGFITHAAFEILREKAGVLCDAAAIRNTEEIKAIVLKIEGVKNCHNIRSRGRLDDVYLDLHVQIEGHITLEESHKLSHIIGKEINKNFPNIVDVLVHMEPIKKEM